MPPTTTQRGLGHAHQVTRKKALALLPPGAPCPRPHCGHAPMYPTPEAAAAAGLPPKLWHLDLDDFPGRVFGGPQTKLLAHRACNRAAGAQLGNKLRMLRKPRKRPVYDRW